MSALSCHLCAFAFVPSHSTCWFNASTVLDMPELFRLHFFQEKWASVVVKMLLEGISFVTRTAHLSKAFAFFPPFLRPATPRPTSLRRLPRRRRGFSLVLSLRSCWRSAAGRGDRSGAGPVRQSRPDDSGHSDQRGPV